MSSVRTFLIAHRTRLGKLFHGDCQTILPHINEESCSLCFADPPFNLDKQYGNGVEDSRKDGEYIRWCLQWLDECIRVLEPGGAIFVYNLPKWNMYLGAHLQDHPELEFRHWIANSMKVGFPIRGKLYPAHYSLLYFTKGSPRVFNNPRVPIETCRHCDEEIKDYGGYRDKMREKGKNLSDVWTDISPVRHKKYKSEKRSANQLSTKLLNRVVQMTTNPGDVVLDPFAGSGTTLDVCEELERRWIGIELGDPEPIIERLETDKIKHHETEDVFEYA